MESSATMRALEAGQEKTGNLLTFFMIGGYLLII